MRSDPGLLNEPPLARAVCGPRGGLRRAGAPLGRQGRGRGGEALGAHDRGDAPRVWRPAFGGHV